MTAQPAPAPCPLCGAHNDPGASVCRTCTTVLITIPKIHTGYVLASRYEIVRALGAGGMGIVYEARDRLLSETVAIKVLRPEVAGTAEMAQRFISEIKLARAVSHRNVCRIHEYGEDQGIRYISMAFVSGLDIRRILKDHGPLPPALAHEVAIQAAEGLQAIHEEGIIHRDLKPANITVDPRGVVRVMDFGLAKQSADGGLSTGSSGHMVGTPDYMSPEQVRGMKLDVRSDVYALGIVVYELFTGRTPFRSDTPVATILKHLNDAPELEGIDSLPDAVVPVVRKALQKDPAERYATVRELGRALDVARSISIGAAVPDFTVLFEQTRKDATSDGYQISATWVDDSLGQATRTTAVERVALEADEAPFFVEEVAAARKAEVGPLVGPGPQPLVSDEGDDAAAVPEPDADLELEALPEETATPPQDLGTTTEEPEPEPATEISPEPGPEIDDPLVGGVAASSEAEAAGADAAGEDEAWLTAAAEATGPAVTEATGAAASPITAPEPSTTPVPGMKTPTPEGAAVPAAARQPARPSAPAASRPASIAVHRKTLQPSAAARALAAWRESPHKHVFAGAAAALAAAVLVFLYFYNAPHVLSADPARGGIGQRLALVGRGFSSEPEDNEVLFAGDRPARVLEASRTRLTVEVPELDVSPWMDTAVPVTVKVGERTSSAFQVSVYQVPRIHTLKPEVALPGDEVVITGGGWGLTVTVKFGAVEAQVLDPGFTSIRVRVPAIRGPAGTTVPVVVSTGAASSNPMPFRLAPRPR